VTGFSFRKDFVVCGIVSLVCVCCAEPEEEDLSVNPHTHKNQIKSVLINFGFSFCSDLILKEMKLCQREIEKLVLHNAGYLAQKRLARGLKLNSTEALALIATQVSFLLFYYY
jgi:hypothetical protein